MFFKSSRKKKSFLGRLGIYSLKILQFLGNEKFIIIIKKSSCTSLSPQLCISLTKPEKMKKVFGSICGLRFNLMVANQNLPIRNYSKAFSNITQRNPHKPQSPAYCKKNFWNAFFVMARRTAGRSSSQWLDELLAEVRLSGQTNCYPF